MSVIISIRVEDTTVKEIEEMGYKPGDYTKKALEKTLRKEKSRRALEWLEKHRLPAGGKTGTELIREDRDSR